MEGKNSIKMTPYFAQHLRYPEGQATPVACEDLMELSEEDRQKKIDELILERIQKTAKTMKARHDKHVQIVQYQEGETVFVRALESQTSSGLSEWYGTIAVVDSRTNRQ